MFGATYSSTCCWTPIEKQIGTLIYIWVTKGGISAYLGSSFAFIAPTSLIISSYGGFDTHNLDLFSVVFVAISLL
jgi:uracil permease